MADLTFNTGDDYFNISYTPYNPLSNSSFPSGKGYYYLLNSTYGSDITIGVTPSSPPLKFYYVLIGPPGSAGSSENGICAGGGATGCIGQGYIMCNSLTVLRLTFSIGETSLSFAEESAFFTVGCGQSGSDQYENNNSGGNGSDYYVNSQPSTPAVVSGSICGSAGGSGSNNNNGTYGPNGTNYGPCVTASSNNSTAYVTLLMADTTIYTAHAGNGGSSNVPACAGGPPAQALFYYLVE